MKTKLNRLLALVMALMMVFQMPASALADGRTTYQAPSFNLGDLIPQDQISYQIAVEHYTTDGQAIEVEGAPSSWSISGRNVSREIDASVTVNDPTYVYQYAVLQSTEKDNLAFETKGIGIDKHGMLCALNKNTGELTSLTTKGDFVLKLFYEVVEVEPTYLEMYAQMQNMGDAELATLLNSLTPDGFHQMILFSRSGSEVEKWTLLMSPENMKAYNNAYSGRKYYAKAAEQEVETANVSTYALRSNANTGIMLLADDAAETADSGVNLSKNATYKGENSAGNEVFELNLEAWTDANTAMVTKPLDIVMVLDASGSMAQNSDAYKNVGTVSSITNWNSDSSNYRYVLVNGNYYRVRRESNNGSYRYYYQTSNDGTENYIDGSTTAYQETTRLEALKQAATNFVSNVNAKAAEMKTTARFSIIQFAGGGRNYNQASVRLSLQNGTTVTAVNNAINGLTGSGATYLDDGLNLVPNQFTRYSTAGQTRVVVIFTDGDIGYSGREEGAVEDAIASGENIRELNPEPVMYAITIAGTSDAEADLGDIVGDDSHVYSSTSGMSIDDMFNQVLQDLGNNMEVQVIDYLDARFYMTDDQIAKVKAKYGDAVTILKPTDEGNSTGTYVIIWNTTITSNKNDGDGTQEEGESFLGTIEITRKPAFVGDNNEVTNQAGSGVYSEDGKSEIELFPQPEVNLQIRQYGQNVTKYRLLGTTEGITEAEAKEMLYSLPAYDPTLGIPTITYTWVDGKAPNSANVLTTMNDTSYIVNVVVTPSAGDSSDPGNYNDGPITVYVNDTTDPNLTLTYKMVKPTFQGGSMELFLGEKVGDFYDTANLVSAVFSAEDAAHFTTDEINAYKANIKYYVGDVELKDYVPSSTAAGTVTVTAYYGEKANGIELGTANITLTLHKGAIQVTKTTSDGSTPTVNFEVTAVNTGAATFSKVTGTVTPGTPAIVGATEFNADASVCNTTYTLPMGTYTVTETAVNPNNYTETTTTRTVTLGRNANGEGLDDDTFTHTGSVNLVNTRRTTSATITKAATTQTVVDNGTFTMQAYLDGVAYGDPFTLTFGASKEFTGLPVGANFKVVETGAPAYYTTTYSAENGITLVDAAASNTLTVTNTRAAIGDVTVKKVTEPSDYTTEFDFTYTINGGTAQTLTVTANDAAGATITGLYAGDTLVITETGETDFTLTDVTAEGLTGARNGNSYTISTMSAGGVVTFTNTRDTAAASVTKTLGNAFTHNNMGSDEFTVTVAGPMYVNGVYDATATATATFDKEEFTADSLSSTKALAGVQLLKGETYTITETVTDGANDDAADYTVTGTGTATFNGNAFVVTNTRDTVSATITKAATTQTEVDNGTFTMQAYLDGVAYGETFTLAFGASEEFTGLPAGATFKVVELNAPAYYTVTYSAEDGITLSETAANTLTVTNTRGDNGNVVLKKVTVRATDTTVFAFAYRINDGAAQNISVTANDANGVVIPGLKLGDKLVITETPDANYTLTGAVGTANVNGSLSGNAFTVDHVMGTGDVTFTNARNAASLTVEKSVVDDTTTARPYAFQFQAVKGSDTLTIEVTWNGTAYEADPVTGLLAGDTWTVTETGYKWAETDTEWITIDTNYTNAVTPTNGEITLQTGANTVAFTNTRKAAGISVAKVVDFGNTEKESTQFELDVTITKPGETAVTKTILAIVTVEGENISYTYKEKGSDEAAVAGAYPLANLPVGTTVAIAETAPGWDKTIPATYTIVEGDTTAKELTVSNERVETTVTGTKTWEDESDKYGLRPDSVTLTLLANGATFTATPTWTNTDTDVWTYTYTNLPTHTVDGTQITYTVEETPVTNYQAPAYDTTHLNITNTLDTSRTVVVTKHWDDNGLAVTHTAADVAVTLTYVKDGDTVTFDGTAAAAGEGNTFTYTFTGVPMGLALNANETIAANLAAYYNTSANTVAVVDNAAEFTNTRKLVDVTIEKASGDEAYVADQSFNMTATANVELADANKSFSLTFGGSKTITIPVGTTITVAENGQPSYYKVDYSTTNGTVVPVGGMTITVTNTRQTATLNLTKSSDFAQKDDTITLTVNGPVVTVNGTTATVANGDQTVTFTYDGSKWNLTGTAPVMLVGQTYTITEGGTDAGLFTYEVKGGADVTPANTTAVSKEVVNTRKTTSLTLNKNVTNPVNDTAFTFTLTCANLAGKTFGDVVFNQQGVATVTVANNGSKTISGLPVDVTIAIAETGADNYDTTIDGVADDDKATSITLVEAAASNVVTYANTRTVTEFTVQKVCEDPVPGDEFTLTVTGAYAGNDSDDAVRTYIFVDDEAKAAESETDNIYAIGEVVIVPSLKGATYTVVETAVKSSAANYTTTGEVTTAKAMADRESVIVTNTRDAGSVVYAKIAENVTADGGTTFTFLADGEETTGETAQTLSSGDIETADFLAGETVTITETANASYTTSYILVNAKTLFDEDVNAAVEEALAAGAAWQEGLAGNVTAYAGDEAEANRKAVVYKNVRKSGTASINKTITNPASVLDAETFSITLTGNMLVKGADGTYTLQNTTTAPVSFTKNTAGTAISLGDEYQLLENEKYTVTETMTNGDLTNYVVTGANTKDRYEYTYTAANATAVVNNQKSAGGIKVSKTVNGYSAANETFTLEITGNFAAGSDAAQNGKLVVTLAKGETKELTGKDGIILGQEYTVTETGATNYTTVYTVGATETNKITAAATAETLVVTNTRTTGDLTVKKSAANATAAAGLTFTFTISTAETDLANQTFTTTDGSITFGDVVEGKVSATLTLTVEAGTASQAQTTISGLPKGVTFTVTEDANANYTVSGNGQTAAIGDTVTVTNTRQTGTMTLTKTADYQVEESRTYWFRVNGVFENEVTDKWVSITLTKDQLATGNTATVGGLLDGQSYTITEVTGNGSTTTVTDYTFNEIGYVTFTFDADAADFTVSASNSINKGTVGVGKVATNFTENGGTFTFTLKGATSGHTETVTLPTEEGLWYATFNTFFAGETVTITETPNANYTTSVKGAHTAGLANGLTTSGTTAGNVLAVTALDDGALVNTNSVNAAVFANNRDTANAVVTKVLNNASLTLATEEFVITVTGNMLVDNALTENYTASATIQADAAATVLGDTKTWSNVALTGPNGELIELLDGETYTINEVIYNATTDTDKVNYSDRYDITLPGENGSFAYTGSKITVTNDKKDASLYVKKTTSGYVDVTSFDVKVSGLFATGTTLNSDGTVTVNIPVNGTPVEIPGVLYMETYQVVEELADDNYTVDLGTATVAPAAAEASDANTITVTNTRKVKDLTIDKVVVGTDADKAANYSFTVTGRTNESFTLADATAAKVIENVPVGMTVTITETLDGKYTTTATANGTAAALNGGAMTYTISETAENKVVYTNTRNAFANSQIVKTMSAEDYAAMNATDRLTITVEGQMLVGETYQSDKVTTPAFDKGDFVKQADGSYAYTYNLSAEKKLLEGETYEVTETGNDNFTFSVVSVATGTDLTTAVITVSNVVNPGAIKVQKNAIVGYAGDDSVFTVEIIGTMKNADGETVENVTITAVVTAGGAAVTVTDGKDADGNTYTLIAGQTYTVTETGADNYTVAYANQSNTAVADADDATVTTITNTRKAAQLTITKTVEDMDTVLEDDTFTFTVVRDTTLSSSADGVKWTKDDETYTDVTSASFEIVLAPGETATITGLFLNEPVTVTEAADANYTLTNTASNLVEGKLPAQGEMTFTNERKEAQPVTLVKEMSQADFDTLPSDTEFTFHIYGEQFKVVGGVPEVKTDANGSYIVVTFAKSDIKVTGSETQLGTPVALAGLLYGVSYTAIEQPSDSYTDNRPAGYTFNATEETTVTATNVPVTGKLSVTKEVEGVYADMTADEVVAVITVTGPTGSTYLKTITVKAGDLQNGVYTQELTDVIEGQTYTVAETTVHEDLSFKSMTPADGKVTAAATTAATTPNVTVVNQRDTYTLTINKATNDLAGTLYFKVEGLFADGSTEPKVVDVETGKSNTVSGLLAGYTYTVTEYEDAACTIVATVNHTIKLGDTELTNGSFTVNNQADAAVTVTNTRKADTLTLSKTVADTSTVVAGETFTFTVVRETGLISGDADAITVSEPAENVQISQDNKTISFTLEANQSATISGLFQNETVQVIETAHGNYDAGKTTVKVNSEEAKTALQTELTLAGTVTDTVAFTNVRKDHAGLAVNKVVKGHYEADEIFTVCVTGQFQAATATKVDGNGKFYVEQKFAKTADEANNILAVGTEWIVPGVLYGVDYVITETISNTEYITPVIATSPAMPGDAKVTVTVTNEKQTAEMTLNKTMLDNKPIREGDVITLSVTGPFNFTGANGTETVTTTLTTTITTALLGQTIKVAEMADAAGKTGYQAVVGTEYTVTETITGAGDLDKVYATTFNGGDNVTPVKGTGNDTRTYTYLFTAAAAEGVNVAVVNERLTAPLTLKKTLVDSTESAVDARIFTYEIAANQDLTEGDVTWDATALLEGESVTPNYENNTVTVALYATNNATRSLIVNLPVSVTYTITETDGAGYNTAATGLTDFNDANRSGSIELMDAAEVGFTNTRGSGALVVTKNIVGYDTTRTFAFTLTETNGGKVITTFELTDDGTETISGLATDTQYTITETGDENYTTTVSVNGGAAAEALYADVAISSASNTTVAFTNTRDTGALTVTKAMVGPVKSGDSFQLVVNGYKTITDSGKTYLVPTDVESEYATYTVTPGEDTVIDGLMAGVTYTITEKLTNGEIGTNYSAKWSDGTEGFVLSNVAGGADQAVTLTNTRDAKVINVTKAIDGEVMPLDGEEFVIQVTGAEGFQDAATGNQILDADGEVITTATATFTYDASTWTDNQLTLTVLVDGKNVDAYAYDGGNYTFNEISANGKLVDDADFAWVPEHSDANTGTEAYELAEEAAAFTGTVTNTRKNAKLTVTKTFDGIMAMDEIFEISVTGIFTDSTDVNTVSTKTQKFYDDDLISGTVSGTLLTKDGNGVYTATWEVPNVIYGNVYTVTEKILVGTTENTARYEAAAITSNNEPADKSGTVVGDGNAQVYVVNTRELTDLTVSKAATNVTTDGGETFTFTVTSSEITLTEVKAEYTTASGVKEDTLTFENATASFELKAGESIKLINLPDDVTFTVTETDAKTGTAGNKLGNYTTTYQVDDADAENGTAATITLGGESNTVAFTNERKVGKLTLTKNADQLVNGETNFYIGVKGIFAGSSTETEKQVVVTVSSIAPYTGTAEVEGLLDGEQYTVTEYSDADYDTAMSAYSVTVGTANNGATDNYTFDTEAPALTVTNSANTAKLTVTKTFVGPVKAGDVFVVTINAQYIDGKLVVTEDTDKMVSQEITEANPAVTFTGLIDGQTYVLTETLKDGELTTNYTYEWTYGQTVVNNANLTVTGASVDQNVALENTRKHSVGKLVKTMEDANETQLAEASNDEFAITVTGQFMYQDGADWKYTTATEAITMTIPGNEDGLDVPVALVEDGVTYYLVYGNEYAVTEAADAAYTATVRPGATFSFDGNNVWESDTDAANIQVDNALEMKTITVQKTVVDKSHEANALDNEFTFTYSRNDGLYGETFQLKNGQSKTFTYPADVTVTIAETANDAYTTTVQLDNGEAADALKIEDVEEGIVTFTNTRILKTMDATKVVAGPDPITLVNESDVEIAFTFRVLKGEQPVKGVTLTIVEDGVTRTDTTGADGTFTIYNGEVATATNLADNYTYTFDEVDQPDFYLDPVITVDEETGLTTITNPREEKTLEVTKALEAMTRALEGDTFTLKVTGRFTNDPDNDQTLTFVFDMNDGTLAQLGGEATKTLMEAEELKNLETEVFAYAGLTYELTEEAPENFDEPVITAITEGETGYAGSVENIRSRSTDVTLTKVVENVSLMDDNDVFTITVDGEGIEMSQDIAKNNLTIDEATDTATFTWTLADGQTLLDGETYTVAETVSRDGVLLPEIAYGKTFEATGDVSEEGEFVYDKPETAGANVVTVTNLPEAPEPEVDKTADQANVQTGDTVTYTVTYTNTSYSAAVVTGIVDNYDQRLTFVPGTVTVDGEAAADPVVDTEDLTLTFADLIVPAATEGEDGEVIKGKITLTYQMSVALLETDNGHAEILNTIEGDCLEEELGDDNTIIGDDPVITVEKKVSDESVYAGEGYTYTIVVTNSGLVQGVVEVTDTLDKELIKFVEFSGTNPVPGVYEETDGVETLSWKFNIPAAVQDAETGEITPTVYELSFKVNTVYAADGTIVYNKATVESNDPFDEEETNEVETVIKNPPAFIVKSADKEEVNPGEQLEYTIKVVSNSLAAHPVVVEDLIPDGMTFKSFVTLGLGGVQDAENPQKLTWSFEMPAATRVDEENITPAIVEIKFTVTADALTETNVENVTNVAELDETPGDPTDDPIPSNPVDTKIESEVWVEKYASTNFAYVGTTFMYVFRFYNTNTAPVTGRFVDYFNEYLAVVDFEKAPGTAGYEHVTGQQIYEDNSIGIDFALPAATANADGTVTPSWVDVGVYVQALDFPADTSTTITIPNTGAYRDDLSNEVKNTNTVYVLVEETYVLPVTGEWTMYLVPVGALLTLLGVALMIHERRRRIQGTGR